MEKFKLGMKKFVCRTYGVEGIVGPYPAGEVCPHCGREQGKGPHQCNFEIFSIKEIKR